jgi:Flp pilus assembly protein TadB
MTSPSRIDLIAALAGLLATGGIVLGLVGIVGTVRPPSPPSRLAVHLRRWWTGTTANPGERRTRQATLVAGAVTGAVIWLLTGWPVAGLVVMVAVPGIAWLFVTGVAEKKAIARLEAVETWTRRLADIVERGIGLQAAIVSTAPTAPTLIEQEVRHLAAQLQAGTDPVTALRQFGDAIADYTCDQVIAPLILQVSDRSEALAAVLTDIARSIAAEIEMRSTVNAKRAGPRFAVRFLTGMTIGLLLYGAFNPTYLRPYGTPLGQVILAFLAALYALLMLWVSKLSQPERLPRLLAPADQSTAQVPS